uniref:Uncharacterized protein n=1 Tax=Anguilla anguilla TaxID=7936 RepID=A0A0E9U6B2_ANGAN
MTVIQLIIRADNFIITDNLKPSYEQTGLLPALHFL